MKGHALCGACNIPKLKIRIPQEGGHDIFATTPMYVRHVTVALYVYT